MAKRTKTSKPTPISNPSKPQPELIHFGHSHYEFNSSKFFGTAVPFPLNYTSPTSNPLPSPANDILYTSLSPIPTPDPIKRCCAICYLHQTRHFHSSVSSKRCVPIASEPTYTLQDVMVFHGACLYAYLLCDNKVFERTSARYEKLRELKEWVGEQKWDGGMLEEALDRVLEKVVMSEVQKEKVKGEVEMARLEKGVVVI